MQHQNCGKERKLQVFQSGHHQIGMKEKVRNGYLEEKNFSVPISAVENLQSNKHRDRHLSTILMTIPEIDQVGIPIDKKEIDLHATHTN